MGKHWRIHPHDPVCVAQLERAVGVSPVVAQLLASRGVTDPVAARTFLDAKLMKWNEMHLFNIIQSGDEINHGAKLGS